MSISPELQAALLKFLTSNGPWFAVLAVFVLTLPKIIPAISAALLEHRKLSHKRKDQQTKIANSIRQRRPEALNPPRNDRQNKP